MKLQAESLAARFLDALSWKVIADLQEAMLGYLEYVSTAYKAEGWVVSLEDEKGPRQILDLPHVLQEFTHTEAITEQFFQKLGEAVPTALRDQLRKDKLVRNALAELTTFAFARQGLPSALTLQKSEPTAEQLTFWTDVDQLQLAMSEILPESGESVLMDFFAVFRGPLVAELNSAALAAYREIGSLVDLCVSRRNNKTSCEDAVQMLLPQLPATCRLRQFWSAFLEVA